MKTAELNELTPLTIKTENVIHLPGGLLGFERIKKYILLSTPEEAPFLWLQMLDDPNLAFLVVSPCAVAADYQPEISDEDTDYLGLQSPKDALVFNIVTLHPDGHATVNLKGPIVLNRFTLIGKQLVPKNVADYSLSYPLPAAN
ncbi:MAG TPA: flagellar assembly protein FliW [Verrucomicrobiales bacterium]|nr:flagellar assembly protein FliW [Verrucomicrobiales bacterium]